MLGRTSRKDKGWIRIAQYKYAVPLKNGQWSAYEGEWSSNGEDYVAGLSVLRDDTTGKPMRFNSLAEARARLGVTLSEQNKPEPQSKGGE